MIRKSLEADIGYTWERQFVYKDANGVPVDFTAVPSTVHFTVHRKVDNTIIDTALGVIDNAGNIRIKFTDEETATWPNVPMTYELVHVVTTNGENDKFRLMSGDFKVNT